MGCWDETCGVTQVPIVSGDPVALIFLTNCNAYHDKEYPDNHSGHCYSTDIWSPRALPVLAKYNDYGGIEEFAENWNTEWIIKGFQRDLIEKPLGENEYHDHAVLRAEVNIERLVDLVHDNRVEILNAYTQKPVVIGFMMVHGWVWDMWTTSLIHPWQDDISLDQVIAHGVEFYNGLVSLLDQSASDGQIPMNLYTFRGVVDHTNSFSAFGDSGNIDNIGVQTGIRGYREKLLTMAKQGLAAYHPDVVTVITDIARYLCFHSHMDVLRKTYAPQSGKGSQTQAFDQHIALAQGAVAWMRDKKDSCDECDEHDEDE